jgi:L-amino acid N-acyltransferase YncA
MIFVRPAGGLDTPAMARLLNEIIAAGGTTALTNPVDAQVLAEWMVQSTGQSAWHVALDDTEQLIGFQWIGPHADLPAEAADIATFVQTGRTGIGIGSTLFNATVKAARRLGYRWINARIRADNTGGLIYYQSRGFEDYGVIRDVQLSDGSVVDQKLKRYNL